MFARYLLPLCLISSTLAHAVPVSDEFNDPSTLSNWTIFNDGPNAAEYYDVLDIDTTTPGHLTFIPGPGHSGWYATETGGMLAQEVTGNFVVSTHVRTMDKDDIAQPPSQEFNSVGLLARNPDTSSGNNYVMTNVGMQSGSNGVGTETKTTVNSSSVLTLTPDLRDAELRICRLGDVFHMYKRSPGETEWTEINTYDRPDLPATLLVGVVANGWEAPTDVRAEVDYVRFGEALTIEDCTAPISTVAVGDVSPIAPVAFARPNPAFGALEIVLPTADPTTISIFDSAGRLVDRLESGGATVLPWSPPTSLAPGVYFAELTSTSGQRTSRIRLVRLR